MNRSIALVAAVIVLLVLWLRRITKNPDRAARRQALREAKAQKRAARKARRAKTEPESKNDTSAE